MIPLKDNVPSKTFPIITCFMILLSAAIYIYQSLLAPEAYSDFIHTYGFIPSRFPDLLSGTGIYTAVTNIFLHGGWLHLISNMLFLWIFGDNVEDRMGHFRFFLFYILCGIAANLVHMLVDPSSAIPVVGASGAIAGIMGAYLRLFPYSRVRTLILLLIFPLFISIPAPVFIVIWFITQLYSGAVRIIAGGSSVGGVAWWAHAGGFIAGFLFHRLFICKRNRQDGNYVFPDS